MRQTFLSTFLTLSILLAACGGSSSKPATISSAPGPTGSSGPSSAGAASPRSPATQKRASPTGKARGGRGFDRSTVRVSFLEKSFFGAKSQVVYFIAREGGQRALAQAKACVTQNLGRAPSAYCFAFPSDRALRFSRVSHKPPSKMQRPCWVAYWGKPSGRHAIGSASNPAAPALHCPDAAG